MRMRCTSEVPSPISRIFESRHIRATGNSFMKPYPPWIWVASRALVTAVSLAYSLAMAASRLLHGEPFKKEAALAKLYSSEIAVTNAREATQVHGGYGFMNEFPVARMWRDSKILEIGEGTSEVQRMLISRSLGL